MKKLEKTQINQSNEEGFTLIEVLIAGALGIIVAFAIAQSSINASQAERSSALDLAQVAMISRLENAIDDPALCPTIWRTWDGGSSTYVPAVFDPTSGPPPVVDIDRIDDGAPTDIARTFGLAGAPSTGITFPNSATLRMRFSEPVQVSENTYNWTFRIATEKIAPTGVAFSGSPITMKRIRVTVTTNGSAGGYTAVYCGPPVSPEANQQIPMIRFTAANPNCDLLDDDKDTACRTEFGPLYVAAQLQDLVAYRMIFSIAGGGIGANGFRFSVSRNVGAFSNSNSGARDGGTVYFNGTGGGCNVACIRNTAPLRFTRDFFDNTLTDAVKTQRCQEHVGFSYVAGSPNDLIRYGFRPGSTINEVAGWDANAPGGYFAGIANGCLMGWPLANGGPVLDCGATANPIGKLYPLACVLR